MNKTKGDIIISKFSVIFNSPLCAVIVKYAAPKLSLRRENSFERKENNFSLYYFVVDRETRE